MNINTTAKRKIIFHVDVNSAFLSWEALYHMKVMGGKKDLREIPSAVGGDEETRHGIILAKSTPAKAFGITTGEPIVKALAKCPALTVVKPHFSYYVENSMAFIKVLERYAPEIQQFSIDEAFLDMTGTTSLYGDPVEFAHKLKDIIKDELGFTVNIGVSTNKMLAKMASDFTKPDRVHTLFPEEIETKLWPLPVSDLLYVGKHTAEKLYRLGISTIGQLAAMDKEFLISHFKKQGEMLYNYSHGIDDDTLSYHVPENKGYGNSTTLPYDLTDADTAKLILLSLSETVGARIRKAKAYIRVVSVTIVTDEFIKTSKQVTLPKATNVTEEIYTEACRLFDLLWDKSPIRLLGVSTSHAQDTSYDQLNMFDMDKYDKLQKLNMAVDKIRDKYGEDSIKRAVFTGDNTNIKHMTGGINKEKRNAKKDDS